jgi:hypothetical protein
MNTVNIQFTGDLNDFIPQYDNSVIIGYKFKGQPSIKHLIEAIGIPHPEVGEIFVNSRPEELTYKVMDMDEIIVNPRCYSRKYTQSSKSPINDAIPKFVLDIHLGKLAKYLRMVGLDTLYHNNYDDELLAEISYLENRILLTRDRELLKRKIIKEGYWIRSLDPIVQIEEVLFRYDLIEIIKPFQRCLLCNHSLKPVEKNYVMDQLEPLTRKYYNEFYICSDCSKVYWKGSHYDRMIEFVEKIKNKGGLPING